jgi:hypothetical protein
MLVKPLHHSGTGRGEQLALPIDPGSAPAIAQIIRCSACGREIVTLDRRGRSEYRNAGECFECSRPARRAAR